MANGKTFNKAQLRAAASSSSTSSTTSGTIRKARLDRVDCCVYCAWVCTTWAGRHVVKEGIFSGERVFRPDVSLVPPPSCCDVNRMGICPSAAGIAVTPLFHTHTLGLWIPLVIYENDVVIGSGTLIRRSCGIQGR